MTPKKYIKMDSLPQFGPKHIWPSTAIIAPKRKRQHENKVLHGNYTQTILAYHQLFD